MKNNKFFQYINTSLLVILLVFTSCQDFDEPAFSDYPLDGPQITLTNPNPNGTTVLLSADLVTSITINFTVADDIAISNVLVLVDNVEVANLNQFDDPRMVVIDDLIYDNVDTGTHSVTITATDSDDNVATVTAEFVKEDALPYNPQNGEVFYMPFDGDYNDLVTTTSATAVGNPGFAGESVAGDDAYDGATNSYLTYPSEDLAEGSNFSATFWLKIDASDDRAGILSISPAEPSSPSDKPSGFGLIREGSATAQKFILLVGNGTNSTWVNPGDPATIDPTLGNWVHFGISISESNVILYMDGELVGQSSFTGIDWTGVGDLSIMSGDPNFNGWNHKVEKGQMDELRLYNTTLTQSEIQASMLKDQADFYMNFNGNYIDAVSGNEASEVGNPGFNVGGGISGDAYQGAANSYLTFPSDDLAQGSNFSAAFWLKIDVSDDRAGIINIAPAEPAGPSDKPSGFGLIREGSATSQKFILLTGNGTNATWVNPGDPATIDPTLGDWVHFGIVISENNTALYMDGVLVGQSDFPGIDWAGVGDLAIMSGDPNFNGWNHKTEKGQMDELYIFKKALSADEVNLLMNN